MSTRIARGLFLCILTVSTVTLRGGEAVPSLLSIGGGYWDAHHHEGPLFQAEYKFGEKYCSYIRPQATFIVPDGRSLFFGVGVALELYVCNHLVFTPNFSPGLYYRGSGKNLGCPIEFRSCLEMAYEWDNCMRLSFQYFHISNGKLSCKNPGANAYAVMLAIPLSALQYRHPQWP